MSAFALLQAIADLFIEAQFAMLTVEESIQLIGSMPSHKGAMSFVLFSLFLFPCTPARMEESKQPPHKLSHEASPTLTAEGCTISTLVISKVGEEST